MFPCADQRTCGIAQYESAIAIQRIGKDACRRKPQRRCGLQGMGPDFRQIYLSRCYRGAGGSRMMLVTLMVLRRFPVASVITTSWLVSVDPRWSATAVAVTSPSRAVR